MKDMTEQIQSMHRFFKTYKTYDVHFRLYFLKKLKKNLLAHQDLLVQALYKDFKKPYFETYTTEIYMVLTEIETAIHNLKYWTKPKTYSAPFPILAGSTKVIPEPYGISLIFAPYNYPIQLALSPLIGAISAGNCVVLKPSEYTPYTSKALKCLLREVFPTHLVWVIDGGPEICQSLLKQPIDYIFFTGSIETGKKVMAEASKNLIPITLELGGKNPAIVDAKCDLQLAAKRIAWGKFMNSGQTCVAPDYVLVHEDVTKRFLELLAKETAKMFENPSQSSRLIHEKHYVQVLKYIDEDKIYYGGHFDHENLYIEPTILYPVKLKDECMQQEIFGPILPVIPFSKLALAIETVQRLPKPLACYIFSHDKKRIKHLLKHLSFGGGCINDTIMHLTHPKAPFGGVGYSGIGAYHGKYSFDTFSHYKTVCYSSRVELPLRYPPYDKKLEFIKRYITMRFR